MSETPKRCRLVQVNARTGQKHYEDWQSPNDKEWLELRAAERTRISQGLFTHYVEEEDTPKESSPPS